MKANLWAVKRWGVCVFRYVWRMLHIVVDDRETKAWIKHQGNMTTERSIIWNERASERCSGGYFQSHNSPFKYLIPLNYAVKMEQISQTAARGASHMVSASVWWVKGMTSAAVSISLQRGSLFTVRGVYWGFELLWVLRYLSSDRTGRANHITVITKNKSSLRG